MIAYKCDTPHSSSVLYPDCRPALLLCDTSLVAEVFDIQSVRLAIQRLMERDGIKRKQLAKAAGLGETAIRDIFKGSDVKASTLVKLADFFAVPVDELAGRERVPVVGGIGAGGCVIYEDVGEGETVPRPPIGTGPMVALEVRGESMLPKYEPGDIIYIQRDPLVGVLPQHVGRYCAVRLKDGSTFLKKLMPGSEPGKFTLVSLNAGDMPDVEVEWATRVLFVLPRESR